MAESNEEKTAFHTSQGVYCYTKMTFVLKNAGATYQRLVDKAFDSQVGRNIEVYVDDLVSKSHTEAEMLRDIDETFRTLRKINMKLNPKKYTFGAVEGMFLGYIITLEGIKLCPSKTEAVLQLPSTRTIKEVQSLNGKLASLNRSETGLQAIKATFVGATPVSSTQTKGKTDCIPVCSPGAISAVLMTERGAVQMPIYFVSCALQGPELNYTLIEKLVLSLVFAAKRLRRYFQAHPIAVITDQPIKRIMSCPDVVGRLQKWSVMLGDHNITYHPWTSVKGQIPTDFLVEKPDENSSDTPMFTASNNEAEYEALIAGLRIAAQMGVRNVHVLVEILKEKSIQEGEVAIVVEEEGPTWMTPIMEYLKDGTLPGDRKEASKLRIKARQYELLDGILYKRSFLNPWLRCVGPLQADYVI
ncbi:reverse transcriptase domain-containing protein [Tanacetum coccineum]